MFAVMKTGGKQYRVQAGDVLRVEKLAADAGEKVQFNEVLMVGSTVGTPLVEGAAVQAEIVDQIKGEKVIHFVRRRRKHSSKRTKGHRQQLTLLKVTEILEKGAEKSGVKAAIGAGSVAGVAVAAAAAKPAPKKEAAPKAETKKAAPKKEAPKKEAPKAEAATENAGTRPANLLDAPRDGKPDDLKKISGVGPKLEQTLNAAGVFHYWQIASFDEAAIAALDEKLKFKGRIERDDWVGQAAALRGDS